jgi:hypothetical protein
VVFALLLGGGFLLAGEVLNRVSLSWDLPMAALICLGGLLALVVTLTCYLAVPLLVLPDPDSSCSASLPDIGPRWSSRDGVKAPADAIERRHDGMSAPSGA